MAIEPQPIVAPPLPGERPVIENEIVAYRAISPAAIFSLILGVAAVFCFTDLWFLVVAAGAVGSGVLALRTIKRLPDIFTGANFARAGIVLGMLFGICSITREVVGSLMIDLDAGRFARQYVEILKSEPMATAFWYQQAPAYRETKTPDQVLDEMNKANSPAQTQILGEKMSSIKAIKARLATPGQSIEFNKIESRVADGLTQYANALVELDGPKDEEWALLAMVKVRSAEGNGWVVKEVKYPYKPASAALAIEHKIDDGHGH